MDRREADGDLVLIQTFLLYYVNQGIRMLTSIFSRTISITKQRRFVSKQHHCQPHIHSKARVRSPQRPLTKPGSDCFDRIGSDRTPDRIGSDRITDRTSVFAFGAEELF